MQILENTELDFSDVLIRPRRSTLSSRKDVDIQRDYHFKWTKGTVKGTGVMQANMGTIGTFEVSKKMLETGLFACLHKHYDLESLTNFYQSLNEDERDRCFLSIGLKDNGFDKFKFLYNEGLCNSVCIDVPNGYIPQVKELVIKLRETCADSIIMVGNVVTGDIVEDLILNGCDIVKCGIGGGSNCLDGYVKVKTKSGLKSMFEICEGDEVLTHTGEYHKVLTKLCYNYHKEIITINGIKCTPEHKFLVINKTDVDKINDENYMEFAYWQEAYNIDEEKQLLLKIN